MLSVRQVSLVISLIVLALLVSGVNQCQKDYVFCPNCKASASTSPDGDDDDDDDDLTSTTTTSVTTSSRILTTTSTGVTTTIPNTDSRPGFSLLQDLSKLSEDDKAATSDTSTENPVPTKTPTAKDKGHGGSGTSAGNWLGKAFSDDDDEEVPGQALDSDGDGFTDRLESKAGTDSKDTSSVPPAPRTRLGNRLDGVDDDHDGVPNVEETGRGLNAHEVDSDGDGVNDGAEILSRSSPSDSTSRPDDHDGDGLSSNYESTVGTDFNNPDTDGDGARDDIELAMGMNALDNDSDNDGILDGKELALGSDPTVAE